MLLHFLRFGWHNKAELASSTSALLGFFVVLAFFCASIADTVKRQLHVISMLLRLILYHCCKKLSVHC